MRVITWILLLQQILLRSHGFLLGVVGAGSSFGEAVVVESGPGSGSGFGSRLDSPEI